ncbi:MAG TPA: MBL fold metallo-hydrolase [Acidobacteriaceae bacterium]|nr:MBL fold metallo-hydrolase [Acidobacteriaceae bacterium]
MMRMTVLASGSDGNSTLVSSGRTRILVDAGLSCRELLKRMQMAQEDPAAIDALLITHEHQDHVQGVAVLARKLGVPVYFTQATHRAWVRWMMPQKRLTYAAWLAQRQQDLARQQMAEASASNAAGADALADEEEAPVVRQDDPCRLPGVEYFTAGQDFSIGDIAITPFTIPHDAADPVGFVFESNGVRMAIATDLGYMPPNVKMALRNCDVLMLESNHDLEMLRDGPYPWSVKQRVMSRVGHLSNEAASDFLQKNYDGYASYVVLAHLSKCNNLPELARVTAERALRDRISLLANKLLLAQQDVPLEPICL